MAKVLRAVALCLAASIATWVFAAPASACMCPPEESAEAQAAAFDLVALAKMEGDAEIGQTPFGTPERIETEFTLLEVMKGDALEGDEILVISGAPGNPSCGIRWREGSEVMLLAKARQTGGYSAWMCSIPQFSEADFRAALKPGAVDVVGEPETAQPIVSSPQPGAVVEGSLKIEGTFPAHWFFENAAHGALLLNGEVIDEFPVSPISSQNWTEPGDKTVAMELTLTPPGEMALELRIMSSSPDEERPEESVTIPFTVRPAAANARDEARRDVESIMTGTWPDLVMDGDVEAYGALLWRDYILVQEDGSVVARDALLEGFREEWITPVSLTFDVSEIVFLTDASALVVGRATSELPVKAGEACTITYAASHGLRRFDGAWSLASSHISGRETTCEPAQ